MPSHFAAILDTAGDWGCGASGEVFPKESRCGRTRLRTPRGPREPGGIGEQEEAVPGQWRWG